MIVKINGKEYTLKYNVRTLILFERMADKPFSVEGLTEWAMLAYAAILSGTPDADVELEDFLELTPDELNEVISWLMKQMKVDGQMLEQKDDDGSKKK